MKNKRRYLIIFSLIAILGLGLFVKPSFSMTHAATIYTNFVYKSYDVQMVVNDDNSYEIMESISVQYGPEEDGFHKGWERLIPIEYPVEYKVGGKTYKQVVKPKVTLDRIGTSYLYDYYYEDNFLVLQLTEGKYVNNQTIDYVIKYTYDVGCDYIPDNDNFYFNIIGSGFPAPIENVSFSIIMPKSFDANGISMYKGKYGSTDTFTNFQVNGNTISGSGISLGKEQSLTINMNLPEGYFSGASTTYKGMYVATLIVAILGIVLVGVLCIMLANHDHPTPVVQFYPPTDMSPAEAKYILDGRVKGLDVGSIIVLWANKGYVSLGLNKNNDPVSVTKISEPNNLSNKDKQIWDALFVAGDTVSLRHTNVTVGNALNNVASQIRIDYDGRFESKSVTKLKWINLIACLPVFFLGLGNWILRGWHDGMWLAMMLISMIPMAWSMGVAQKYVNKYTLKRKYFMPIINFVLYGALVFGFNYLFVYTDHSFAAFDPYYVSIWGFLSCVLAALLSGCVLKLNAGTYAKYGNVYGFKHNIEVVEENQLKLLLKENPSYFYDVLPYAYAFGITNKFINKFKRLTIPENTNGISDPYQNVYTMRRMRYNSYYLSQSAARVNAAARASRGVGGGGVGSGGSGGGGFSGGGHGGGGGRGL